MAGRMTPELRRALETDRAMPAAGVQRIAGSFAPLAGSLAGGWAGLRRSPSD